MVRRRGVEPRAPGLEDLGLFRQATRGAHDGSRTRHNRFCRPMPDRLDERVVQGEGYDPSSPRSKLGVLASVRTLNGAREESRTPISPIPTERMAVILQGQSWTCTDSNRGFSGASGVCSRYTTGPNFWSVVRLDLARHG
jgi:hypothetical protein